ncbi:MAG: hypothetical protein WA823_00535 [Candidatus Acidiferrales bacterium]
MPVRTFLARKGRLLQRSNAAQTHPQVLRHSEGAKLRESAIAKLGLSARAHDRILNRWRAIADLDGADSLVPKHLGLAIQHRTVEGPYWT